MYYSFFTQQSYPELLAQGIYSAFCAAFPNSWRQFDEKFKSDLCNLTNQWIVGTRPMPNMWMDWNIRSLEPTDMRKEVLMKKDPKKSKRLFNLTGWGIIMFFHFPVRQTSHILGHAIIKAVLFCQPVMQRRCCSMKINVEIIDFKSS